MKAKRLMFLVMAICLASGVKAQFYDGPDDIYFYLAETVDGKLESGNKTVLVFNFDGKKACWWWASEKTVKSNLRSNQAFYEEKTETTEYELEFTSSSYGTSYKSYQSNSMLGNQIWNTFDFSSDRQTLTLNRKAHWYKAARPFTQETKYVLKRVDKSYFRVGRSRNPSGTMYE